MIETNMEAEYKITELDYVRAMKLFSKIRPKMVALYVAAIVLFSVIAVMGSPAIKSGAIGGLIVGGAVIIIIRLFINPFLSRRHYRKYKAIQELLHIHLKDEGVQFSNADGKGLLRWNKILKWRQDERYILIYPMPRLYHIVPKTIKESGFDLKALTGALETKVGKET